MDWELLKHMQPWVCLHQHLTWHTPCTVGQAFQPAGQQRREGRVRWCCEVWCCEGGAMRCGAVRCGAVRCGAVRVAL